MDEQHTAPSGAHIERPLRDRQPALGIVLRPSLTCAIDNDAFASSWAGQRASQRPGPVRRTPSSRESSVSALIAAAAYRRCSWQGVRGISGQPVVNSADPARLKADFRCNRTCTDCGKSQGAWPPF